MISFGELKTSSAINVAGVTPNSDEFRRLVNESVRRLLSRGDFSGTVVPIYTCITNGQCVVWPRYVGNVRQLNTCRRNHVPIANMWWDFLPYDRHLSWHSHEWWGWMGSKTSMVNQNRTPVFQDILGDGRTIRAYSDSPLDDNKSVWIFGEDNNGQALMTKGIGPWKDGLQLVLKAPYVETPINVRRIDRVIKDRTNGPVRLYAWNSSASVLEDVAYYEPSETHPSYLRSRLSLPCSTCSSSSTTASPQGVIALVKLAFVPVFADTDWVMIDNITSIKHMIQCVRCEESQDFETARVYLNMAVDELNQDLANDNPETQIPVDFGELGHNQHYIGHQRTF